MIRTMFSSVLMLLLILACGENSTAPVVEDDIDIRFDLIIGEWSGRYSHSWFDAAGDTLIRRFTWVTLIYTFYSNSDFVRLLGPDDSRLRSLMQTGSYAWEWSEELEENILNTSLTTSPVEYAMDLLYIVEWRITIFLQDSAGSSMDWMKMKPLSGGSIIRMTRTKYGDEIAYSFITG